MAEAIDRWCAEISERLKISGKDVELSKKFGNCRTDEERVLFVYSLPCVHDVIKVHLRKQTKCAEESVKLRSEGNVALKKGEHKTSLDLYTKSILKASPHSNEIALAFSNRSAILFVLKKYKLCLRDIELSLKYGYPECLQYKLYNRRGKCYLQMRRRTNSISSFEKAKEMVCNAGLDTKTINTINLELEKDLEKSKILDDEIDKLEENFFNFDRKCLPSIEGGLSHQIPCASSAFELDYNKSKGRYPVAARDIRIGETIVIEKPYASVVLSEFHMTHCTHCCHRVVSPLPCPDCCTVIYCSNACQQKSWKQYHYAECSILNQVKDAGVRLGHLALRMVVKAGRIYLLQNRNYFLERSSLKNETLAGCNPEGIYNSDDYHAVHALVGHSEDRTLADLFRRTMTAVFLLKCLENTSFFSSENSYQDRVYIGGHILRHIQMLPCNAHEVSELDIKTDKSLVSETCEVASAIYATLSLINHSCDPKVVRHSHGDVCVLRAIQNIYKGEEISDNYGSVYAMSTRNERRAKLRSQYYFECNCNPCKQDWPLYNSIPNEIPVFCCNLCKGQVHIPGNGNLFQAVCNDCRKNQDISEMFSMLTKSDQAYQDVLKNVIERREIVESLPFLLTHLQLLDDLLRRPWRDYNDCQEALKQCYSMMGNTYEAEVS